MSGAVAEAETLPVNFDFHPVIPLLTADEVDENEEDAAEYFERRTLAIYREEKDSLVYGWEPPIWKVADALLGLDCYDQSFLAEIKREFGEEWTWEMWSKAMRECLGFNAPVSTLLISGANRGSKSQYAAKRSVQMLYRAKKQTVWCFHADAGRSKDEQQPLINTHMPISKRNARILDGNPEYMSFKSGPGYSDNKIVNHLEGVLKFKYYSSDKSDTIEGGEVDWAWPDELIPSDWLETLEFRTATREGKICITQTPVQGYSELVRMFQDGADKTRMAVAFACPDDTGEPLEWASLGFESPEAFAESKIYGPRSIPENVHNWIKGTRSQPEIPAGRAFKQVPRVMRCLGVMRGGQIEYKKAVLFFHSNDNPYGNPSAVYERVLGTSMAFVQERFYGVAHKTSGNRFPKFNPKVHTLPSDKMPKGGTNYMICDPSGGRNFVFGWFRVVGGDVYLYREWPGNYVIPGVGHPGPWAEVSGQKKDGKKGPAQNPFGFNLLDYKKELARLENWEIDLTENPDPKDWEPDTETEEQVVERYIDARAGNTATASAEGTFTLIDELADIGLDFIPVHLGPAGSLADNNPQSAVHLINDRLSYDEKEPISYTNRPRFFIAEECFNSIFALSVWTGDDGQKGACKDFIDLIRYFFAQDLHDTGGDDFYKTVGGGCH